MTALTSKLKVWWLTRRQIHITKTALRVCNRKRWALWGKHEKLETDLLEVTQLQSKLRNDDRDIEAVNLLWHSLRDQKAAVYKEINALTMERDAYEAMLAKIKHGIWHPLTGFARSGTT